MLGIPFLATVYSNIFFLVRTLLHQFKDFQQSLEEAIAQRDLASVQTGQSFVEGHFVTSQFVWFLLSSECCVFLWNARRRTLCERCARLDCDHDARAGVNACVKAF